MKVEYHPLAADDLTRAVAYHNDVRPGLGDRLRAEVYATIDLVLQNPLRYRAIGNGTRRCLVSGFPYSVLYRSVDADRVRILVIRHHRRNPRFGAGRV